MRRVLSAGLLPLFLAGCGAGWHNVNVTPDSTPDPRAQYLVHHGTTAERWHAIRVTSDSVSGISWLRPIDCDSCRIAIPRATIDSLQEGHPAEGFWKGFGLAVFGPFVALSVYCLLTGHPAGCWVPPST